MHRYAAPRLLALLLGLTAGLGPSLEGDLPVALADTSYDAVGVVVRFTPDRGAVFIAHEAIAGVMGAMTMSFEARRPDALAGLAVGERVRFRFTVTDDGHRWLDRVQPIAATAR